MVLVVMVLAGSTVWALLLLLSSVVGYLWVATYLSFVLLGSGKQKKEKRVLTLKPKLELPLL